MSNISLYKNELAFLKKEILKKYTTSNGYNFTQFKKELTGYIKIYEEIEKEISSYISDKNNFSTYVTNLKSGAFKISATKIIEHNKAEETEHFLRNLKSYVTANVLRKLIIPKKKMISLHLRRCL